MNILRPYSRVRSVDAADTTFPAKIPTIIEPMAITPATSLTASLHSFGDLGGGGDCPRALKYLFYGTGADNDSYSVRVIGWRRYGTDPNLTLWVPTILGSFTVILGQAIGVAGTPVPATSRFADTITVLSEPVIVQAAATEGTTQVYSPTNNAIGWVVVPLKGCEKVELTFADVVNTPTKNALQSYLYDTDV